MPTTTRQSRGLHLRPPRGPPPSKQPPQNTANVLRLVRHLPVREAKQLEPKRLELGVPKRWRIVTCLGVRLVERWTLMPLRRDRPALPGTVTSTLASIGLSIPQCIPAVRWLSTARSPHARTAAIHQPGG